MSSISLYLKYGVQRQDEGGEPPSQHLQDFQLELDLTASLTQAIRDELNQVVSLIESLKLEEGKLPTNFNGRAPFVRSSLLPHVYCCCSLPFELIGSFRLDYEYEIEYEYECRILNQ